MEKHSRNSRINVGNVRLSPENLYIYIILNLVSFTSIFVNSKYFLSHKREREKEKKRKPF